MNLMNNNFSISGKKFVMEKNTIHKYEKRVRKQIISLIVLVLMLIASMIIAVSIGAIQIPFEDVIKTLVANITSQENLVDSYYNNIIINIRLPRILSGLVVGMALGVAGAIMQTVLQNPMASPYTLGISSGAGLGASLAIIYDFSVFGLTGKYMVVGNAFAFALLVNFLILFIARIKGNTPQNLILAGIALMNLFNAITTLITYFADVYSTKDIMYWQVGSLGKADWESFKFIALIFLLVIPFLCYKANDLNRISMGDEVAKSMGVNVARTRLFLMAAVSLLVASVTAFTGMISFIGLVVPHLVY
jgi:iron complex transport system permease protein